MSQTIYFGTYTKKNPKEFTSTIWSWNRDIEPTWTSGSWAQSNLYRFFWKGNLYSVGAEEGKGGIASFTADFQPLNHVVEEGAPLCYVSVDDKRQLVYGANYHKGQVLVYS